MITPLLLNVLISLLAAWVMPLPILRLHLLINYVLIVNPSILWLVFGVAHPLHQIGDSSYEVGLYFNATYNFVLSVSVYVFLRFFSAGSLASKPTRYDLISTESEERRLARAAMMMVGTALFASLLLDQMGAYRSLDTVSSGPFLQAAKIFSTFDTFCIIFLGEIRSRSPSKFGRLNIVFAAIILASLVMSLLSGSRGQTITTLIYCVVAFRKEIFRRWLFYLPLAIFSIPSVFLVFPVLSFYRNNNYDMWRTFDYLSSGISQLSEGLITGVFTTRLNYLEPLGRVVRQVEIYGPEGGYVYLNNIIGVIPRLIWPGKPKISNESQELGHILGLVTVDDASTSIGLRAIGEAFYELAWVGVAVAIFHGLAVAFVHKKFYSQNSAVMMTIYIYVCFYLVQRDGYFAVVPGLIWVGIGFSVFFWLFSIFFRSRFTR